MSQEDDFKGELMATFQAEVEEHLNILNKGLLALEQNPPTEEYTALLYELFRAAHSLKGAARTVSLTDLESLAHTLEYALGTLHTNRIKLTPQHIDAILVIVDAIRDAMAVHLQGDRPEKNEAISNQQITALSEQLNTVMLGMVEPVTESGILTQPQEPGLNPVETQPHNIQIDPPSKIALSGGDVSGRGSSPLPVPLPKARTVEIKETIRVSTSKLDALMDNLGELLVARMRSGQLIGQVQTIQKHMTGWQKKWQSAKPTYNRYRNRSEQIALSDMMRIMGFLEENESDLKAIDLEIKSLVKRLTIDRNHLQLVTEELQTGIRNARMLPIATLFDQFPRMVRDLARAQGKKINLIIEGENTEVDRQALELLKDPITHILRNAIDHGIEFPDVRAAKGKPRQGIIRLKAEQRGSNLLLEIFDDGTGIDLEAVQQAAINYGLLSDSEAEHLNKQEILKLIFHPGLSTAKQVSEISGRGMGMDIVRKNLEKLHGLIWSDTEQGIGTTYTITLPLTLSTSHILILRTGGETLGLPMTNIERILRVNVNNIGNIHGQPAIYTEERPLPLINLARVLGYSREEKLFSPKDKIPVVVMYAIEKKVALQVDSFISIQEVVIKKLGRQIQHVRNIAGVTIMGDDQPIVILNAAELIKSIQETNSNTPSSPPLLQQTPRRHILITDDSITTRMLEKHILENAGYLVSTAANGQEAWELIRNNQGDPPDLVISDINMPNMDGFTLTKAIKDDPHFAKIPVVLITSREAIQDKIRGLDIGADAYIVKTSFDQKELLETINRLIG